MRGLLWSLLRDLRTLFLKGKGQCVRVGENVGDFCDMYSLLRDLRTLLLKDVCVNVY